jgi:hypothetical protein
MIMICNVPDEVVKSVKMGTWCGSSVAEKMIANGIPLDKIRADIDNALSDGMIHKKTVLGIIDKYKAESEGEK